MAHRVVWEVRSGFTGDAQLVWWIVRVTTVRGEVREAYPPGTTANHFKEESEASLMCELFNAKQYKDVGHLWWEQKK